jgi:hypothetical protein
MLKKMIAQLGGNLGRPMFDPSVLQDPVALKTAWTPLSGGGSNFKTAELHTVNEQRMEFRASAGMKLMALVFLLIGMTVALVSLFQKTERPEDFIPVAFGVVFALVGGGLLRYSTTPTVFDTAHGYFCRSRKRPELMMDPTQLKRYAPLNRVHALQIIAELCRNKNSSYYSYELNLVLNDGSRVHVVDHGNQLALRTDARTLSTFLNKPLWDAS